MKFNIIEIENVHIYDYPDFCDAYASEAEVWDDELNDWRDATEAELDIINDKYGHDVHDMIFDKQLYL
jgi:hypothetical protein